MQSLAKGEQNLGDLDGAALPLNGETVRQRRALVQRIISSPTFSRCERLSSLLNFVCEMALTGREAELNEQLIGQAIFGRSPEYDSSADGIVRTQASRLRQRLDLFFENEGREEAVRLLIPKGRYVPVFQTVQAALPAVETPQFLPDNPETQTNIRPASVDDKVHHHGLGNWLGYVLCTLTAALLVWGWMFFRAHATQPAISTHPLWGQLFLPGQPTLVVPADSGLVLSYLLDGRDVSLHEYLSGDYRTRATPAAATPSPELSRVRTDLASRRYTSIVDLEVAVNFAELAQQAHSSLQVRYARDLRPNDLRNENVILIGAREANPWVELFERRMNFVMQDDFKARFSVVNRSPHPGEPARWDSRPHDPEHSVYGVVAFVPNLSGNGNVLIVEGTSMAGTEAAWNFVSDDAELLPFLKSIRRRDGSLPHFELVVGTQNMSASAVHEDLLAWRLID